MGGDESLMLLEQGTAKWVREEALGSVTGSLFLDLPAPSPELASQWRAAAPTLSERIQAEFISIKVHPSGVLSQGQIQCQYVSLQAGSILQKGARES